LDRIATSTGVPLSSSTVTELGVAGSRRVGLGLVAGLRLCAAARPAAKADGAGASVLADAGAGAAVVAAAAAAAVAGAAVRDSAARDSAGRASCRMVGHNGVLGECGCKNNQTTNLEALDLGQGRVQLIE
jgi:hypothetical protein